MASFLQRRSSSSTGGAGFGLCAPPASDTTALPALVEFLSAGSYADGAVRVPGTLTVFFEAGRWKICLNDRDQEICGWATVAELVDLPLAVDLLIQEGKVDWRELRKKHPGQLYRKQS
jgi:hypothetical protein